LFDPIPVERVVAFLGQAECLVSSGEIRKLLEDGLSPQSGLLRRYLCSRKVFSQKALDQRARFRMIRLLEGFHVDAG
jgi:hypothetical protein